MRMERTHIYELTMRRRMPPLLQYLLIAHKIYRYRRHRVEYTTIFITYFTSNIINISVKWINEYFHVTDVWTERRQSVWEREREYYISLYTRRYIIIIKNNKNGRRRPSPRRRRETIIYTTI